MKNLTCAATEAASLAPATINSAAGAQTPSSATNPVVRAAANSAAPAVLGAAPAASDSGASAAFVSDNPLAAAQAPSSNSARACTLRALILGAAGSAIISAASLYIALRLGALPWPIVLCAIVSLAALRLAGNTNLHEVNVAHTAMSAGSMVAGGLAFTVPGLWILDANATFALPQLVGITLAGTALGLVFTAAARRRFVEEEALEYPIGVAAAEALQAADAGGAKAKQVFGVAIFTGAWAFVRDGLALMPTILGGVVYNSPMMLAVGFMVGEAAVAVWLGGALVGLALPAAVKSSLGMGCMIGAGAGVIFKIAAKQLHAVARAERPAGGKPKTKTAARSPRAWAAPAALVVFIVLAIALGLSPLVAALVAALAYLAVLMSCQSVGETGINPMEIFGVLVLLAVAAVAPQTSTTLLFAVAAIVAVACGLAGDVMNDFKAGHLLRTNWRDQFVAQCAGALVGGLCAAATLALLVQAYGTGAFGSGQTFIATQAQVVAGMVAGFDYVGGGVAGLGLVAALYVAGLPVITLGLGIYLPFYMSASAGLGLVVKLVANRLKVTPETGTCLASGALAGESIVGILLAAAAVVLS